MNRSFLKQFLIALVLFLLGYFSFNRNLFAANVAQAGAYAAQVATSYLPGEHVIHRAMT